MQEPGHTYNACDRGFGLLENRYKHLSQINCPDEYEGIVQQVANATYKTLKGHQILDLKKLVAPENKSFKRHQAQDTKFSKCRQIYLSSTEPNFISLGYYDTETGTYPMEAVSLAKDTWEIYKMKTPREFQTHYLKLRGKTEEEINELLPRMNADRDIPLLLLPTILKPGFYYKISERKLKDIESLKTVLNPIGKNGLKN